MTITEFLLARIAEDEAVARRATVGPWEEWSGAEGGGGEYVTARNAGRAGYAFGIAPGLSGDGAWLIASRDARHIARHDPARVLAECEAKRRIVEEHTPVDSDPGAWCNRCVDRETWPCPTIAALAAIYADHPDYDPEWTPRA